MAKFQLYLSAASADSASLVDPLHALFTDGGRFASRAPGRGSESSAATLARLGRHMEAVDLVVQVLGSEAGAEVPAAEVDGFRSAGPVDPLHGAREVLSWTAERYATLEQWEAYLALAMGKRLLVLSTEGSGGAQREHLDFLRGLAERQPRLRVETAEAWSAESARAAILRHHGEITRTADAGETRRAWQRKTAPQLEGQATDRELLAYFDGGEPSWTLVCDGRVPELRAARSVLSRIRRHGNGVGFTLLKAGAESGKSTAMLQVARRLCIDDGMDVLHLVPDAFGFDAKATLGIVEETEDGRGVCLVIDGAQRYASHIEALLRAAAGSSRRIEVLAAADAEEWDAPEVRRKRGGAKSGARIQRTDAGDFELTEEDAGLVAGAWASIDEGLRAVADVSEGERSGHVWAEVFSARHDHGLTLLDGFHGLRWREGTLKEQVEGALSALSKEDAAAHRGLVAVALSQVLGVPGLDRRVMASAGLDAPASMGRALPLGWTGSDLVSLRHMDLAREIINAAARVQFDFAGLLASLVAASLRTPDVDPRCALPLGQASRRVMGRLTRDAELVDTETASTMALAAARAAWEESAATEHLCDLLRATSLHESEGESAYDELKKLALATRAATSTPTELSIERAPDYGENGRRSLQEWGRGEFEWSMASRAAWLGLLALSDQAPGATAERPLEFSRNTVGQGLVDLVRIYRDVREAPEQIVAWIREIEPVAQLMTTPRKEGEQPRVAVLTQPLEPVLEDLALAAESVRGKLDLPETLTPKALSFDGFAAAYREHVVAATGSVAPFAPELSVEQGELPTLEGDGVPAELERAFVAYVESKYPTIDQEQRDAFAAVSRGEHVVLNTPTGSGKSDVALCAHFVAFFLGVRSVYTAPVKALVNEKYRDLCAAFGKANVGLETGDGAFQPDAPILCCTAEILAKKVMLLGSDVPFGWVVADEFHFAFDRERGWAWMLPLLEMTAARHVLISATLEDPKGLREDLEKRTEFGATLVPDRYVMSDEEVAALRPIPLAWEWREQLPTDAAKTLLTEERAPAYFVSFSKKLVNETAERLATTKLDDPAPEEARMAARKARAARIVSAGLTTPFGRQLAKVLRQGVAIHHSGLLPRYRRLVEDMTGTRLAEHGDIGLVRFVCGTDTLGVGVNMPIRTVVFTSLTKFDGKKGRKLDPREFHQLAGRAGRRGLHKRGDVVALAPEHEVNSEPVPDRFIPYEKDDFKGLQVPHIPPQSRHFVLSGQIVIAFACRPGDGRAALMDFIRGYGLLPDVTNRRLEQAEKIFDAQLESGLLELVEEPLPGEPRYRVRDEEFDPRGGYQLPLLPFLEDFLARRQTPDTDEGALDVVSAVEACIENPGGRVNGKDARKKFPDRGPEFEGRILQALTRSVKQEIFEVWRDAGGRDSGVSVDEMKAEQRDARYEMPLEEELEASFDRWTEEHPEVARKEIVEVGVLGEQPRPKSIARWMYEQGHTFSAAVRVLDLRLEEGPFLKYLSDVHKILKRNVLNLDWFLDERPGLAFALEEFVEWLEATIKSVDGSFANEWESLEGSAEDFEGLDREAPVDITEFPRGLRRLVGSAAIEWVRALSKAWNADLEWDPLLESVDVPPVGNAEGLHQRQERLVAMQARFEAFHEEARYVETGAKARSGECFSFDYRREDGAELVPVTQWVWDTVLGGRTGWCFVTWLDVPRSREAGEVVFRGLSLVNTDTEPFPTVDSVITRD